MKRTISSLLVLILMSGLARAEVTSAQRIEDWQNAINRASEAGNVRRTEALRKELAHYSAGIGDYVGAVRQYDLLLALRPRSYERVRLFVKLGEMKDALKDFEGAIGAFQDALHDDPKFFDANLDLAREYAKVDLNTRAVKSYQTCIALNPKDVRPYVEMAQTYERLGYMMKAIAEYQKAIEIDPQPESYLGLADCYVHEGDVPRATGILLKAKSLLPRAEYDVRLGDIYHKLSDLKHASASWEAALKADPKRDDVRLKLAMVYDRLDRRADTDRMLKSLLAGYPKSALVHFLAAWVFLNRGDHRDSRREALLVQKLAPTEMVQHFNERLLLEIKK
jgi:tetratricopeptide (TPR) repeat protein